MREWHCWVSLIVLATCLAGVSRLDRQASKEQAAPPTEPWRPVSGYYLAQGDGYEGLATLRLSKNRKTATLVWSVGVEQLVGAGLLDGSRLAVGWRNDRGAVGVTVYRPAESGLEGDWTTGDGQVHWEKLILLREIK